MKKFKKVFAALSAGLMIVTSFSGVAYAGETETTTESSIDGSGVKVAVIFASSGLGDKSFNDALYNGMEEAEKEYGITYDYSEPTDDAEYEGLMSGYADTGEYDLIICLGGSQSSSLENVAPNYPDQKFVLLDASIDAENVRCYTWYDEQLGFLAGVLGASLSDTNTLGFIGAFDIALCNLGAAGMIAGARYVNPDCNVLVDYVNGWAEVNRAYEMAKSMHEQGASLIYHTASAGGLGILKAGKDEGFNTIAFDGNLNADAPDTNVASAIRDFPGCAKQSIVDVINGKFDGNNYKYGMAEDAIYMDFEGSNVELPDDVKATYDKAVEDLKNGTITVPSTIDDAKKWTAE